MIQEFLTLEEAEAVSNPKDILRDVNKYIVFTGADLVNDATYYNYIDITSFGPLNARLYGADPTGITDSTQAILYTMQLNSHCILSTGNYRCDEMIEIASGKTLELLGGAFLHRYSANSESTDPVVWIKSNISTLKGAGQGSSGVVSHNRSPNGVVLIGHWDMTASHGHVNYNSLKTLTIQGALPYGQTTGEPDVALMITNPQFNNYSVYFQDISGLRLMDVNKGIWLRGWANANTISSIQGYRIGNTTLGTDKNVLIHAQGALDNSISLAFFHSSPGSIGLLVEDLDNSVNGGVPHVIYTNSFTGLVFEQGGAGSIGLKAVNSSGCYYQIRNNVSGGNVIFDGFEDSNFLFGNTSTTNYLSKAGRQKLRYGTDLNNVDHSVEKYVTYTGLVENLTYIVSSIGVGNSTSCLVEIAFTSNDNAGLGYNGAGKVIYSIAKSDAGVFTITTLLSRYSGGIKPCEVDTTTGLANILFRVNSNGGSTQFSLHAQIKVIYSGTTLTKDVINETLVLSGIAGMALVTTI
jgi:hypothetical protein